MLHGDHAEDGWSSLAGEIGVAAARLLRVHQVHGVGCVGVLAAGDVWAPNRRPEADAIATTDRSVAIAVQVADCVPLLIADRHHRVVCAVHAGWRGSAAAIVEAVVERLRTGHGVSPGDLVAAAGPSIGPCCYEVGEEVRARFRDRFGGAADGWFTDVHSRSTRPHLDMWAATFDQLVAAGVPRGQIHVARLCTAHHLDIFHSYRAEGAGTGRLAGVIRRR